MAKKVSKKNVRKTPEQIYQEVREAQQQIEELRQRQIEIAREDLQRPMGM